MEFSRTRPKCEADMEIEKPTGKQRGQGARPLALFKLLLLVCLGLPRRQHHGDEGRPRRRGLDGGPKSVQSI